MYSLKFSRRVLMATWLTLFLASFIPGKQLPAEEPTSALQTERHPWSMSRGHPEHTRYMKISYHPS